MIEIGPIKPSDIVAFLGVLVGSCGVGWWLFKKVRISHNTLKGNRAGGNIAGGNIGQRTDPAKAYTEQGNTLQDNIAGGDIAGGDINK